MVCEHCPVTLSLPTCHRLPWSQLLRAVTLHAYPHVCMQIVLCWYLILLEYLEHTVYEKQCLIQFYSKNVYAPTSHACN